MKYFKAEFTILPYSTDASDVLAAIAGEAGFESFEETPTGLLGYVQQTIYSEEILRNALLDFPFEDVTISYEIRAAEERDWNEQWEQEGFEPILVECKKMEEEGKTISCILIHDGRHLPKNSDYPPPPSTIEIEIDAHLAFGTGTHETTRMICSVLLEQTNTLYKARVLDCGTGTGILSICALKLGAQKAIGYDIDEWSVDNSCHNAVINHVEDRFQSLLGDTSILKKVKGTFDLVLANINRNILLQDLLFFRDKMASGATLVLSGFYTTDCPLLIEKATSLSLTLQQQKEDNDWACLVFILSDAIY